MGLNFPSLSLRFLFNGSLVTWLSSAAPRRIQLVANSSTAKSGNSLFIVFALVLVTACLYWARQVLIPVALAVLLAFILTPAVSSLQRRGLERVPSVLIVVLLALMLLSGIGYFFSLQISSLAADLPRYKGEISSKFQALLGVTKGGFLEKTQDVIGEISQQAKQKGEKKDESSSAEKTNQKSDTSKSRHEDEEPKQGETPEKPLYVQSAPSGWKWMGDMLGPAAEGLADAFLVLVLVVFMLVQRENLRNRLVRLVGHGRLIVTTQAFDEGAQRISRYLLMQLLINTIVGVLIAAGLFTAGLLTGHRQMWQYAFLWGFFAAVLRFVPYLGTWLAAALMTAFYIATLPGWAWPLAILGFFAAVELLAANVGEPLLFGHSTGVSPLALLLAAAFWTWLWGPIGLILSTPLTVILVVLGKYVPELHFFEVLFGDEPVLSIDVTYYQRLVAHDLDEAADLVEDYLSGHSLGEVYTEILLPTLLHAKRDRNSGELDEDNHTFVLQGVRDSQENLAAAISEQLKDAVSTNKVVAAGFPGRDEGDELVLRMLGQLLRQAGYSLEVVSSDKLTAEMMDHLEEEAPALVVIGSLPPGGLAQVRYLCKRIRQKSPDLKILVGRWGEHAKSESVENRLLAAGADQVAWTLKDSLAQIVPLLQVANNAVPTITSQSELVTSP
jgi:predicted PurR-regulated permease PerM